MMAFDRQPPPSGHQSDPVSAHLQQQSLPHLHKQTLSHPPRQQQSQQSQQPSAAFDKVLQRHQARPGLSGARKQFRRRRKVGPGFGPRWRSSGRQGSTSEEKEKEGGDGLSPHTPTFSFEDDSLAVVVQSLCGFRLRLELLDETVVTGAVMEVDENMKWVLGLARAVHRPAANSCCVRLVRRRHDLAHHVSVSSFSDAVRVS